ncbi:hypothetical protein LCGC14_1816760 [marine sediment metagenome]|uniref:YopX protein domain-containing protein n=1 Tax=marine sediment metagenome TaxID=412755 RepID=A0A0F9GK50_9ZZZZ
MREIKFRAWDALSGEMLAPYCVISDYGIYWPMTRPVTSDSEKFVVMQYTGLKDKNGKEIYEGDIIRAGGTMVFSNHDVVKGMTRLVKKLDSGFTLVAKEEHEIPNLVSNTDNYTFWNVHRDLEVIGNIYENKELLKGE